MYPITIQAASQARFLLSEALPSRILALAAAANAPIPTIETQQIVLSSASPDIGDKDVQLTYPRVCLYSAGFKNNQAEKFRSLSGTMGVVADVWASSNLATDSDTWIHYYVSAISAVLTENRGDWGNGLFFSGVYDAQFQSPKSGGLGFVQMARITFQLTVSVD